MADINYRIILRIIGVLLWLEALSMLLPLAVALYYGEHDINAFLLTIGIAVASGSILFFQYSNKERKTLGKRDGIMVVTLCWIFFSLVGSLPFIFSGSVENLAGAFFETVSGVTGTGASIIPDVEKLPHGILMWRSLIQWLGGLGIILFTLALLPLLNSGGSMQLFNAETTGIMNDKLGPHRPNRQAPMDDLFGSYTRAYGTSLHGPHEPFRCVMPCFYDLRNGGIFH